MDLIDCASYFDDTVVTLPGSSTVLFMGQLEIDAEAQRDGLATERRWLSYDPSQVFTLPTDSTVAFAGRIWALGQTTPDEFQGDIIRAGFIAQLCDSAFQIGSAADWIANTPRASGYAGVVWNKDSKDDNGTEEVWSQCTLYCGAGFSANEGELVRVGTKLYRLHNVYTTSSALGALEAIELPADALRTVVYNAARFDKVTNKMAFAESAILPCVAMRYYHQYRLITQAQPKPKDGDLVIRVMQSATPDLAAGDTFEIDGIALKIAAYRPQSDATYWVHLTI